MSDETAAALEIAVGDYRVTGDPDALTAAAQAHLDASRPLGVLPVPSEGVEQVDGVLTEYKALADAMAAGEPYDAEELAALGTELSVTRQAAAITAGNLPGTGHAATAGIGD